MRSGEEILLLDMGGLAGAVIAGDDDAAVLGEAGENRERGRPVEPVIGVDVGHVLIRLGISRHFHVAVDAENLTDRHFHVGQTSDFLRCSSQLNLRGFAIPRSLLRPDSSIRLIERQFSRRQPREKPGAGESRYQ